MMKYIIIVLVAFIFLSCISQNAAISQKEMSIEDLIKGGHDVVIKGEIFKEEIDFTQYVRKHFVGIEVHQTEILSSITFVECVFNQPVKAYLSNDDGTTLTHFESNVSFVGCKFNAAVNFRGSTFLGRLDFTNSKFYSTTNFEEISSFQNAYFSDCYFDDEVRFQNSFFMQKANFMNSQFNKTTSFQNAVFNAEAQFSVTKFYGYADFSLIDCRDHIFFNYAEFHDRAALSNAHFGKDIYFTSTKNENTRFDHSKFFGKIQMDKTHVKEQLSLVDCFFLFGKPNLDFIASEKVVLEKK